MSKSDAHWGRVERIRFGSRVPQRFLATTRFVVRSIESVQVPGGWNLNTVKLAVRNEAESEDSAMPELTTGQSVLLTDLALCVNRYRLFTPGIYVCVLVPVELDAKTRVVPGLVSMVNWGRLRQCEPTENGFKGPPNFVLDVFTAGELAEYERRRGLFERFGVTEYVAVEDSPEPTLHWNRLEGGRFQTVQHDAPGLIQSKALPGLWIPLDALSPARLVGDSFHDRARGVAARAS